MIGKKVNIADKLLRAIMKKQAPIVVGLDPAIEKFPEVYKKDIRDFKSAGEALYTFNKDILDSVKDFVPAVKPQIAFYEMLGKDGIEAFEKTVKYAKDLGLIVIEDGKRNDIGNTADAYAKGHLGKVMLNERVFNSPFDVDFLTISPFLGLESLAPFIKTSIENNKGVFVLVKTSNPGSDFMQNIKNNEGKTISELLGEQVNLYANNFLGASNYSAIGAVVGATYPSEARVLRKIMPRSIFLVPGYGSQGGNAKDCMPCFNEDGLGAIINASRSIIFAHKNNLCTKEEYKESVHSAIKAMKEDIYKTLKATYPKIQY